MITFAFRIDDRGLKIALEGRNDPICLFVQNGFQFVLGRPILAVLVNLQVQLMNEKICRIGIQQFAHAVQCPEITDLYTGILQIPYCFCQILIDFLLAKQVQFFFCDTLFIYGIGQYQQDQ